MKRAMKKVFAVVILVLMLMSSISAMAQTTAPAAQGQTTEEAASKQLKGSAKVKLVNKGKLYYGDKVTLKAVVKVNKEYTLQWQVKEDGEWKDIKDQTGKTFEFILAPANRDTQFRVMVLEA